MTIPSDKIKRIPNLPDWETLHPGEPLPTNSKQPIYNPADDTTYQVEQTSVGTSPFERDVQEGEISPKVPGDHLNMKDGCLSDYRSEGNYIAGTGDVSLESSLVSNVKHLIENPLFGNSRTITIPDAQAVTCGRVVGFYLDGEAENSGQVLIRTTSKQEINRETSQVIATPGKGFLIQEFGGEWLIAQDSRPQPGAESIFLYPTLTLVTNPSLDPTYRKLTNNTSDTDYPQTEQIATGPVVGPAFDTPVLQGVWTTDDSVIQTTFEGTEAKITAKLNVNTAAAADLVSYAELYHRDALGVETLINTSLDTTIHLTVQVLYILTIYVPPQTTVGAGEFLVWKFYAKKVGGNAPSTNQVQFAVGGFDDPARIALPIPVGGFKVDIDDVAGLQDELDRLDEIPLILSQYDSNTTMSDPGAGKFRINAAGTQIAISHQEPSGSDINIHLNQLGSGNTIKLQSKGDDGKYKNINVTGTRTNNTTWSLIPITIDNEGSSLVLNDFVGFIILGGASVDLNDIPILYWQFDTATADVDPGDGKWRFSAAFDFIYINISPYQNGSNVANILALKNGAKIYIQNRNNAEFYASINVIGDAIDATTYWKIPIFVHDIDSNFSAGDICGFVFKASNNIATTITAAPTITATVLDIDFKGNNTYETTSEVSATANFSITLSNDSVARNAHIDLLITNAIIITLPANSLMQDDEGRWTPSPTYQIAVDGLTGNSYELSFRKVGTKLKWILSQKFE